MNILRNVVAVCAFVPVAAMLACGSDRNAKTGAGDTFVRKEVGTVLQNYADAARAVDPEAAALYTPTGVIFEPGIQPIQSPDSIRAFIKSFPGVIVDSATMTADTIEVFNTTAVVWGKYFEKLRFPGQPPSAQHGRFVMELKQQPNQKWLIEKYYRVPLPETRGAVPDSAMKDVKLKD